MGTNLRPIEQFEVQGFLFRCLDVDAPSLLDFLGGALPFIDLMADQAPDEMEVLRGETLHHGSELETPDRKFYRWISRCNGAWNFATLSDTARR